MNKAECLFCSIVSGCISCERVYEDDSIIAFRDVQPQAPVHVLCVPKVHFDSAGDHVPADCWGALLEAAVKVAQILGLEEKGYRMVINTGEHGGQSVPHLHLHLLAGRNLGWPPG